MSNSSDDVVEIRLRSSNRLIEYCYALWNDIFFAYGITKNEVANPKLEFYYKSIAFNIYLLYASIHRLKAGGLQINNIDKGLSKDIRDLIAHFDEKILENINLVDLNKVPGASTYISNHNGNLHISGGNIINGSLTSDSNGVMVSSPFGVINSTIYSTLNPNYDKDGTQKGSRFYKTNGFTYLQITDNLIKSICRVVKKLSEVDVEMSKESAGTRIG
jgi:hypothetical protein